MTECTIIEKKSNNEYYSCYDCKHCYFEDLDNCCECALSNHSFYSWLVHDDVYGDAEYDEHGECIDKICKDFEVE